MANIYLRLPQYVAAFYRGRDPENPLGCSDAVVFCDFSHEHVVLRNGLRLFGDAKQLSPLCYSQRAWNNMLAGKSPQGGPRILNRNPGQWLTLREICTLEGRKPPKCQESSEYLCIAMPREVLIGQRVFRTTASYALDGHFAQVLGRLLRNEFYHNILDWLVQERRYCNQMGVKRSRIETLERFFAQFNIPVGADQRERESMRRMVNRWLSKAYLLANDRIGFGTDWVRHISDKEMRNVSSSKIRV